MKICTTRFTEEAMAELARIPKDFLSNTLAGAVLLLAKAQRYTATEIAGSVNQAFRLQGEEKLSPVRVGRMTKVDSTKVITALTEQYKQSRIQVTTETATDLMVPTKPDRHETTRVVARMHKKVSRTSMAAALFTTLRQEFIARFTQTAATTARALVPIPQKEQPMSSLAEGRGAITVLATAIASNTPALKASVKQPIPVEALPKTVVSEPNFTYKSPKTDQSVRWQVFHQRTEVALYGAGRNAPFVENEDSLFPSQVLSDRQGSRYCHT